LDISKKQNGFTVVSLDESFFFFYDSLVRRVWIRKDKRPVVRITGSHQESVLFGSISLEGKQLFRQYDWSNATTFLDYLKQVHRKKISKMLYIYSWIKQNNTINQKKYCNILIYTKKISFQYIFQQHLQNSWYWKKYGT
jgi:hypothetical protein